MSAVGEVRRLEVHVSTRTGLLASVTNSSGPPWMWREAAKQVVQAGFTGLEQRGPWARIQYLEIGSYRPPYIPAGQLQRVCCLFRFCLLFYFVLFTAPSQFSSKSHCLILCAWERLS